VEDSTTYSLTHLLTYSPQNWQQRRLGAADALAFFLQHGFGVFGDLFGPLQVKVVRPIVLVFAVLCRVIAANLRPGVINTATVVVLQMPAGCVHQQIPGVVFLEHGGPIVQQEPADELVVLQRLGGFDRHQLRRRFQLT